MRIYLIASLIILVSYSCRCKKEASAKHSETELKLQSYAQEVYGSDNLMSFNEDSSYVVIYKFLKNRPSDIIPTLSYQLLSVATFEAIYKDVVPRADFKWVDDYIIEVKAEKGIPNNEEESIQAMIYRYHAKNRKKYIPGGFGNKN